MKSCINLYIGIMIKMSWCRNMFGVIVISRLLIKNRRIGGMVLNGRLMVIVIFILYYDDLYLFGSNY